MAERIAGTLQQLLVDEDPEVRAQAAKGMGDIGIDKSRRRAREALGDAEPRVQFFAAQSLGKLGSEASAEPLLALLRANDNKDQYLRFVAAQCALEAGRGWCAGEGSQGSVRRRAPGRIAGVSLLVAIPRSRASCGTPTHSSCARRPRPSTTRRSRWGCAPLAGKLASAPPADEALVVRAMNANYRLGGAPRAKALANYSLNDKATAEMRAEALKQLALWGDVPQRDRVVGIFRPMKPRDAADA